MEVKANIKKIINSLLRSQTTDPSLFQCPFCHSESKTLNFVGQDIAVLKKKQVIGGGLRKAGCLNCNSGDRERLVYIYLVELFKITEKPKNLDILHIAPEPHLSSYLTSLGFSNYIQGDLFAEGYQYANNVSQINVLNIPYPDNHFDLIICNHVLEHIEDDIAAMKEIYRVLKENGTAILQVPISKNSSSTFEDFTVTTPEEREKTFGQSDHLRIYGQDYSQRLHKAGFFIDRTNISEQFKIFGLNRDEDLFICKKW